MANLFGVHIPLTGYGPQYKVGDTIPGAQSFIQQYQAAQRPPMPGMPPGANVGSALLARLGYGGLPGVASAYQSGPTPGAAPQAPQGMPAGAPQGPSGWNGFLGGVGNFIDSHRGALSDIGKVAGGALGAYGMLSDMQERKRAERRAEEEADRKRRDQEAATQAVAPALIQLLSQRMGYGQGGG
jgi:hypothetical protein